MNRLALRPLFACCLALIGTSYATDARARKTPATVIVQDAYADMRSGPGRGFPATYSVERDASIQLLRQRTDWIKVRTAAGREGWVHRSQLERTLTPGGAEVRLAGPLGMVTGLANSTTAEEDAKLATTAQAERAKLAELTKQYGRETLEKAYKEKAPWYQFGGVDNAKPERLEAWVQAYMADKQAGAGGKPAAAAAPGVQQPPASATQQPTATPAAAAPAIAPQPLAAPAARPAPPDFSVMAPQNQGVQNPLADKVIQSSTAAADAAKAASEAATAAQNRPNVTQQNTYNVTVQAPAQPGAAELGEALNKALRERERAKDADLRGSFLGQPKY